ncbi:hypothetical protein ACFQV2_20625 [Actinokineospora soli]|uniref:Tetratricopeptide repeat-containing protein n=1 Tax=Actinokineospora soli TaxID=1048753 RepID=A0ABW2TRW5_9PSEU
MPALRALDAGKLRSAASALASAYPGDGATLWRAPTPDRLADTHLLATAEAQPTDAEWDEHVHAVCATDDPAVAEHATRVLTRALTTPGARHRHAVGLRRLLGSITSLVRACPAYLPPLARIDPVRFRDLIVEQVALAPSATVAELAADLTGPTTSRLAIAVAVARRRAADDPRHLAGLSARLAEAGDLPAALDAAERAVALVTDPDDRASAHTALCHRLAEHDRPAEALTAARTAADLRSAAPPAVRGFAQHNLALRLTDAGHPDEAVDAAAEAVDLLLAAGGQHRPGSPPR